jgi:deoxyribonuclease-4
VFTANPRGWRAAELDDDDVARFRTEMKESGIGPLFAHAPYLPNLAAAKTYAVRSVGTIVRELERCSMLAIGFLIAHIGKAMGQTEDEAVGRVADNVNRALGAARNGVVLLLENTAGMGSEVGYRFDQIAAVIGRVEDKDRVGVCLDTAHSFEAGYDWRTRVSADAALREFDSAIGLGRLHVLHLNDSKTEFGSRVDRHWHIGKGRIGREGIAVVVNHPLLRHLPAVMETPRMTEKEDRMNLRAVRRLLE